MKLHNLLILLLLLFLGSASWAQPFDAIPDRFVEPGELPLTGVMAVGQYTYDDEDDYQSLETVLINLADSKRQAAFAGDDAWLHPDGIIIFSRPCADGGEEHMRWQRRQRPRAITPCSSVLQADSAFDFAKLSPDQSKVAVEHYSYDDNGEAHYDVLVFDAEQNLLATFENHTSPAWLPDGRLLVGGAGIFISNDDLSELEAIILLNREEDISEGANNIAMDASGTRMVFEYNHAIWHMQVDGSDFFELISNTTPEMELWFPAWSPDGTMVAYMVRPEAGYGIYANIFFQNVDTGEGYSLDITSLLDDTSFVSGPLSWR